jgi:hypothetical protein
MWDNVPQAHSRVPKINFDIWISGGTLYISHEKLPKDGKVLCHLGFKSKELPGPLTDPRWDNAPEVHSRLSNIIFDIWF